MGGEAKFLRGLAYYNLVSLFGDVPLKTAASSSDGISVPRSPQAEVLALVVQDMKDAMAIDSKIVDGRANSWAIKSSLGTASNEIAVEAVRCPKANPEAMIGSSCHICPYAPVVVIYP